MHDGAFEFLSVELGHGGFQVCASLKLDETLAIVTSRLGVDDVQLTGASCEVFEILPACLGL